MEIQTRARTSAAICPWCKDALHVLPHSTCSECATPVHLECRGLNGGCPSLGCGGDQVRPDCPDCRTPMASLHARICLQCGHDRVTGRRFQLDRESAPEIRHDDEDATDWRTILAWSAGSTVLFSLLGLAHSYNLGELVLTLLGFMAVMKFVHRDNLDRLSFFNGVVHARYRERRDAVTSQADGAERQRSEAVVEVSEPPVPEPASVMPASVRVRAGDEP